MSEFPDAIYTPRETENLSGIVYDPADKKNMYSEDFQNLGSEINAIETILGTNPEGDFDTVKDWLISLGTGVGGGGFNNFTVAYNSDGTVDTITNDDSEIVYTFVYNVYGNVDTIEDGTNTWTMTYDAYQNITSCVKT